jgi:hypothetical protein
MGTNRLLLAAAFLVACLASVACLPEDPNQPNEAVRQVMLLAAEGSEVVSSQPAPEPFGGMDTWCIVTESEGGKERWLVFRAVDENDRPVFNLGAPPQPADFERLGCTNWDG